jgi:ribosomal protein S18 acetylase RimI-like enzyme
MDNWYKIAKSIGGKVELIKRDFSDRRQYVLVDKYYDMEFGKLTIQSNLDPENYWLTAFFIDPNYRGRHFGSELMNEMKNDPDYMDKDIILRPATYDDNQEMTEEMLYAMYIKFGFEPMEENPKYLVLRKRK